MLAATLRGFWAAVALLCAAACLAPAGRCAVRAVFVCALPQLTRLCRRSAFREVLAACAGRGKLASSLPGVPRWLNVRERTHTAASHNR